MSSSQRRTAQAAAVALGLACSKERNFAEGTDTPTTTIGDQATPGVSTTAPAVGATQTPDGGNRGDTPAEGQPDNLVLEGSGAGVPPAGSAACVPAVRDCTSALDNDCDGQPDNAVDSVCTCTPGATEACGEHPGLDGNGICRAGQQTCVLGPGNTTARFGACEGSVGPNTSEICTSDVDDDCDGVNNEADECDSCTDTCFCEGTACVEMAAIESLSSTVCALSATGRVWCWGGNQSGQAGVPGFLDQLRPAPVEGLEGVTMIAVGGNTNCALLEDTSVVCWGTNFDGELGDNGILDVSFSPVQVVESSGTPLLGISKIVAGAQYACALRTIDGAVFCWGAGAFIGNGTNVGSPAAVQTLRFGDVPLVQIGDIEGGTDVVLARSGASWLSWGRGRALGQGEANASLVATQLMSQPLPSFTSVSVGPNNGCGTTAAGEAYCWGNDIVLAGLGAGETDVPTRFAQLDGTAAFEISSRIGFAVDADGRVRAFGDAGDGLAAGLRDDAALEPLGPTELPGIIAVKQLAQGVNFACALQVDDTVACWGINNRGQIGIGSTTRADAPVLVQPLRR